jgi:mxaK protein
VDHFAMAIRAVRRAADFLLRGVGIALAIALVIESWQLARAQQVNRQLAARLAEAAAPTQPLGEDARLWVAAARQAARGGHTAEAAALLRRAADASHAELRQLALYDLGNVYLQAALKVVESGADASGLPLFELAKESYRSALMERPDLWDAKFNLELALRAAPDPDPDDTGAPPVLTGERAVTTMRAFTLGLP